jgi:hypothetical protein
LLFSAVIFILLFPPGDFPITNNILLQAACKEGQYKKAVERIVIRQRAGRFVLETNEEEVYHYIGRHSLPEHPAKSIPHFP